MPRKILSYIITLCYAIMFVYSFFQVFQEQGGRRFFYIILILWSGFRLGEKFISFKNRSQK